MGIAYAILILAAGYAMLGVIVGGAFVVAGVSRVDPAASGKGAPWYFRVIILPGAAALWPLVILKWARAPRRATGAPA